MPVATLDKPATAAEVAAALLAGGISCIEIAFRRPGAAEAVRAARAVGDILVGAGTVLSPEQADAADEAGADFAVAPGTNETVVQRCRDLGLPFFPGVATPTEIERARGLELRVLKVFPAAQIGGPSFLRAVSATYPDVGFLPTGGVTSDNVGDYLAIPSVVACGGSWLVAPELVRERRFGEIADLASAALAGVAA
ncbi:MAG: bifunctional 4-hydroxy-2-oxoglutarate aldolase/2-dehydro-3-deoxy-phosphogluconate aldolase [Thermoleophilia bacterium]|nr:bifunctional 4-hydroxy-2-oxoglutarate aldolase/2-dehydro-3-deoxy-phosphogluconate aldolase [Thermoleophilia bacterium]